MRTFSLFTTDSRYSVPTLTFVIAEDDARARVLAQNNLAQSEFHTAVEVLEGDRRVCQLRKQATCQRGEGDAVQETARAGIRPLQVFDSRVSQLGSGDST